MSEILWSEALGVLSWTEGHALSAEYGPKAGGLSMIPRPWTPQFMLLPASFCDELRRSSSTLQLTDAHQRLLSEMSSRYPAIIVRSSVIGETIWDRGAYFSDIVQGNVRDLMAALHDSVFRVLISTSGRSSGIVIQGYVKPDSQGEFGNLLRISSTRDHWEYSIITTGGYTSRRGINTQRDPVANEKDPLGANVGRRFERRLASFGAWINSVLLAGRSNRVNCEWVRSGSQLYVVQLDNEDEDLSGVNPRQIPIEQTYESSRSDGSMIRLGDGDAQQDWDKLSVLQELWEPEARHKPRLFYLPLEQLEALTSSEGEEQLAREIGEIIGQNRIVARTSVRSGAEKLLNLPRTDCLPPLEMAKWCIESFRSLIANGHSARDFCFVLHRFIESRASAWVRVDRDSDEVIIHCCWGLPDALQFCRHDIWEVHIPTLRATEYTDYKSDMLTASGDGVWRYQRIRNDLARHLSIRKSDAIDIARRSKTISDRLGLSCHIMWFCECLDSSGRVYNLPWYWTQAHPSEPNMDRSTLKVRVVRDRSDLQKLGEESSLGLRSAIELSPEAPELIRDNEFISSAAAIAGRLGVPVILHGSTLAHAYFLLRREGCTVIAAGEKSHVRVRGLRHFGKIVRDKIPERISARGESGITQIVPQAVKEPFLIAKVIEESMEFRSAKSIEDKISELGDLYEVISALAEANGFDLDAVAESAAAKKLHAGGFDTGAVLLQTGISPGGGRRGRRGRALGPEVMTRTSGNNSIEIPFSFFGFAEFEISRVIELPKIGLSIKLVLHHDRLVLTIEPAASQLKLL